MTGSEAFDVNVGGIDPTKVTPPTHEIIDNREAFYVPVSLGTHDIFCGDEREVVEISETDSSLGALVTPEAYIHWFGGGLNIPYNLTILEEVARPGSVRDSFEARTDSVVPVLIQAGIQAGVHSDTSAEEGPHIRLGLDGGVGCGYADKRQPISQLIGERGVEIVSDASMLRPELFRSPSDYNFAHSVVAAHGRLAERNDYFTSGRRVMFAAVDKGAKVMLVNGDHTAKEGVINLVPDTSLNTSAAARAGLPAYNHDSWAVEEVNDRLSRPHSHDQRQRSIADLIDTIGTMRALGVTEIAVRRPEDLAEAA